MAVSSFALATAPTWLGQHPFRERKTLTESVTRRLADWIMGAEYRDIPAIGIERIKERFLDSFGVQFGGAAAPTGQIMAKWVKAQNANPECTIVGADFKTSCANAALLNAVSGHALELCDIASFSGHPANPLTAAALALGEKLGSSGRDVLLAWAIAWEVTGQTTRICLGQAGNDLINRGWFNQGFQPALGVAAMASRLMGLDVRQTQMAIGNAASAMGGIMKNRGSDTKSFAAGNAAMHGIMAAELVALGFTANENILDGEDGVARMLGVANTDPERVLAGLGAWDIATKSSTIRTIASCAAGHWGVDALQKIVRKRPINPDDIEAIDVYVNDFLISNKPYHAPQTGLEAKFSIEYDVAAVALHGKAGKNQFTDALVRDPRTQAMMKRITLHPVSAGEGPFKLEGRTILTLRSGEKLEETSSHMRGAPEDPLSTQELHDKFHEMAAHIPRAQRERIIAICDGLGTIDNFRDVAAAIRGAER
jgi:2-methylcitrate dehydratase PrpD